MANVNDGARSAPASPSVAMPIGSSGIAGKVVGVTRIGARAGLLAVGVLGAIVLAIVYGISSSGNHHADATPATVVPQILATSDPDAFANIPGADPGRPVSTPEPRVPLHPIQPAQPKPQVQHVVQRQQQQPAAPVLPDPATQPALQRTAEVPDIHALSDSAARLAVPAAPSAAEIAAAAKAQRLLQAQQQAEQLADAARHSSIVISASTNAGNAANAAGAARGASVAVAIPPAGAGAAPAAAAAGAPSAAAAAADAAAATDPTTASQRAKNEFLSLQKSTTANDYLTTPRQASISPYEVQAGSIIPAILVSGINSDLPGTMIGQVSKDVYDSKTGSYLLIPAGSKIVGRYDSQVANGQSRVLVAWQRILFPDASFIDINGMAGADTAGYAGLTGKVDDHSGKLFRNALVYSIIGAGASLLQPRTAITAVTGGAAVIAAPSAGSQVAGQVGTQLAQTAQQALGQGVQQAPTIEVRPGYLFNIVVDRDLVLPGPYGK